MSSPLVLFRGRSNRVVTVLIAFLSIDQFLQLQMINDLSFDISYFFSFIVVALNCPNLVSTIKGQVL